MHIDRAGETVVFASAPENIIGPIVTEVLKSMHFRRLVCLLPSRLGSGWERAAAIMMAAAHGLLTPAEPKFATAATVRPSPRCVRTAPLAAPRVGR